jgi:ABC-type Mn2+/Zn2+ transport system permease subunit
LRAVRIVGSVQAIGILLVFGLLIGPPATASLIVRRIPLIMLLSMLLGAVAVVVGLGLSYHYGTAGGATIAGVAVGQFFVLLAVRSALDHRARSVRGQPSGA